MVKDNPQNRINVSKDSCYGCSACKSVCPKQAIAMDSDDEGFRYPRIDINKCINCGRCIGVCPAYCLQGPSMPNSIFAVRSNNEDIRLSSSSGGVFSQIASYVESCSGIIYGVSLDGSLLAKHTSAKEYHEWKKFKTSKYMQSDLGDCFSEIRRELKDNRLVFFTGTPCQVHGLKKYLADVDTGKLITCDIVCHGVPSPKVWTDYLKYIKKVYKKKVCDVNFRDKNIMGWHNSTITLRDSKSNIILSETQDVNLYFKLFFSHYILRPSCYNCKYSNLFRVGDITIGDFWGIENHYSEFDDDKGVSLLMVNSDIGKDIWEKIKDKTNSISVSSHQCLQPNLVEPAKLPNNRYDYWEVYKKSGFVRAAESVWLLQNKTSTVRKCIVYAKRFVKKLLNKR